VIVQSATHNGWTEIEPVVGEQALAIPTGWSVAASALFLVAAAGGVALATLLTLAWWRASHRADALRAPAHHAVVGAQ
jgi:hypothetical protein